MNNYILSGLTLMAIMASPISMASDTSKLITGSNWILTSLTDQPVLSGPAITLHFDKKNTISGSDGCNQYQGTYTVDGNTLSINRNMISTQMACPGNIATQADNFISTLINTSSYAINGDYLSLQDGTGKETAVFDANNLILSGTDWQLIAYNNGKQAVVSVIGSTEITASFGEDGQVTGNAGCNNYFAKYAATDESIEVGPAGATRKFCAQPSGVMDQEIQFLTALQSVAIMRLDGNKLSLRRIDGALAVTLIRK